MKLETLDDLPETLHSQFEKVEEDGKTYYQDLDSLELKNLAFNVKNENKSLKEKNSAYEQSQAEAAEKQEARIKEEREKALEEARNNQDVKAIEERYKQQMEDLEKRSYEKGRDEAMQEMTKRQAVQKAGNISKDIAYNIAVEPEDAETIEELIAKRVEIDPSTGDEIYKDAKGGALSVDRDGFIAELKKERKFKRLIKNDTTTSGGGLANGSGSGGAAKAENQQAKDAKSKGDLNGFLAASLKDFKP